MIYVFFSIYVRWDWEMSLLVSLLGNALNILEYISGFQCFPLSISFPLKGLVHFLLPMGSLAFGRDEVPTGETHTVWYTDLLLSDILYELDNLSSSIYWGNSYHFHKLGSTHRHYFQRLRPCRLHALINTAVRSRLFISSA